MDIKKSAAKVILRAINYKIIIKIIIIISDDNDINNRYQVSYSILPTEMLPISISKKTLGFADSLEAHGGILTLSSPNGGISPLKGVELFIPIF